MPDSEPVRLLILGGTAEAARLAGAIEARFGAAIAVTTSLAGRTRSPGPLPGSVRTGGFGGADGLANWVRAERIGLVVDATHPFATEISAHARQACGAQNLPRLGLVRPPWRRRSGDDWRVVPDLDTAAALLPDIAQRVFLSVGAARLDRFGDVCGVHLVVRMIDPPDGPLPLSDCTVVLGRGPFDVASERSLLRKHRVDALVSRNSGGAATYAKIEAARQLSLPVVMIAPPVREPGPVVETVEDALRWISERMKDGAESRV